MFASLSMSLQASDIYKEPEEKLLDEEFVVDALEFPNRNPDDSGKAADPVASVKQQGKQGIHPNQYVPKPFVVSCKEHTIVHLPVPYRSTFHNHPSLFH